MRNECDPADILPFVEPIYRFCLHRVSNRADAEDLAGEILLHVLCGMEKYEIRSLEAWVWRIAHNRYARFCAARQKEETTVLWESASVLEQLEGEYDAVPEEEKEDYETVFRCLHTLSAAYRDITVDYYIGGMSVREIAVRHNLSETTVKWRLNVSRQKIRDRIDIYSKGECEMEKIYKRINWAVDSCNGSMDSAEYLNTQIARAICEAAYEKPLTIEEISLATGLPTMYIEDALPKLIYGDAIEETGGKYVTNFIVLRVKDREAMEQQFRPLIGKIADFYADLFAKAETSVEKLNFYGHDFGMKRLGYIAVPYSLRSKVTAAKERLPGMENGPYPPRKDGGYGWFIIEEAVDSGDSGSSHGAGCNITGDADVGLIYWYHIEEYFRHSIYTSARGMFKNRRIVQCESGRIPNGLFPEDDIVRLLEANLIVKDGAGYKLNFAFFPREQFETFASLVNPDNAELDKMLEDVVVSIKKSFREFTPKHLDSQINQWVSCFVHRITAYVIEELLARGVLEPPDEELPLTNGVFYVEGASIKA